MPEKKDESEIMTALFDEVFKLIRQKQIRLETLVQRAAEYDILTKESCDRISKTILEHSQKKNWS